MDIQVGDRVTYFLDGIKRIEIVTDIENIKKVEDAMKRGKNYKILKIERPKYEVIEEKKELLTENKINDIVGLIGNKICNLWTKCPKNSINGFMIVERNYKVEVLTELLDEIKELELED